MENIIIRVVVNFRKYFPKKYLLLRVPTGTFDNFVEWQVPLFFFFFFFVWFGNLRFNNYVKDFGSVSLSRACTVAFLVYFKVNSTFR